MTAIVKTYDLENERLRKYCRKECPVKEVSVEEVSGRESINPGIVLRESVSLESVHKEVSVRELYEYQFISETLLEEQL